MQSYDKLYIGGAWTAASGKGTFEVTHAGTGEVIGRVPAGDRSDVERAVRSAKTAFESWGLSAPAQRAEYLQKILAGLAARSAQIAETVAREVGMPLPLSKAIQAGLPMASFQFAAQIAGSYAYEQQIGSSIVVKEPAGVVGCITPWNYPLHQVAAKVAPALAAGCTVILKPSEVAPLSAFLLAEIIDEVKLPPGVFNLVSGDGPVVGEAIASHPDIDMVSFTGSTRAGRRVGELAAQSVKRVALELGGKSPNLILDDADLSKAVPHGVKHCYLNSGQTCSAWTRMLVPQSRQAEVVRIAKATAEGFRLGDPLEPGTTLGPLVSRAQQQRVQDYIRRGIEEGATLVTGGCEVPDGLSRGYFVKPTIFADVNESMTIAQEEIFGPVLCIMPYTDEEDAIRIANQTVYGLAGGVWSADPERAKRVARRLRTGQVDINGAAFNVLAPFGGYKQSGRGREAGTFGFEEYLEIKSLQL
jgi:acyl-CoA reductase-like NAD-dependent aldehyde dehydrogenase